MLESLDEYIHNDASRGKVRRVALTVSGMVQGVGFRPFVQALATQLELSGNVKNESGRVRIEIEGRTELIREFAQRLLQEAPKLARIEELISENLQPQSGAGFRIDESGLSLVPVEVQVPSDVATCDECLRELFDETDRRYFYPFLNCVNCGPRLTIIEAMPYDRERTAMKDFKLCDACRAEYEDPKNRRFHAQPVACPACGPMLSPLNAEGEPLMSSQNAEDVLRYSVQALRSGSIVAIKGLGGFHLACDAGNSNAVRTLRNRKRREHKAFAVMVQNPACASDLAEVSDEEKELLESSQRPIVLLRRCPEAGLAPEVCLDSPDVGVMLPYTPLHELLLRLMKGVPLVMTSGNVSDQPMLSSESEAVERLREIADYYLVHDRLIHVRCDDSVVRMISGTRAPTMIRRSRGYAPQPIGLSTGIRVLAAGAQLKNTFAIGTGNRSILSHHIGDLDELSTFEAYKREISHYERLFETCPELIVHDLHPDYLSTRYALERASNEGLKVLGVQHHHAHLASCMADNRLDGSEKIIGVTWDGAGYGTDGKIWGGEFLLGDYRGFERIAHLRYVPMPGGEKAIREPWRMALAYLLSSGCEFNAEHLGVGRSSSLLARQMIERGLNCPETSSVGRLFDAVAALLGLGGEARFEGELAMKLEALALQASCPAESPSVYPFEVSPQIDLRPWISAIVQERARGLPGPEIASRFHRSLVNLIVRVCDKIRTDRSIHRVALSGGVFMNRILLGGAVKELRGQGFEVYCHQQVPPNDGGISLGQLAVAKGNLDVSSGSRKDH